MFPILSGALSLGQSLVSMSSNNPNNSSVLTKFTDFLKPSDGSLSSLIKNNNIQSQGDLNTAISNLTDSLKQQPELAGLDKNEPWSLSVQNGKMSVTTASGKCVTLQPGSEASQLGGLIHQLNCVETKFSACPGTSLDVIAKAVENNPQFNARWSLTSNTPT
jgi:hypothetical protein